MFLKSILFTSVLFCNLLILNSKNINPPFEKNVYSNLLSNIQISKLDDLEAKYPTNNSKKTLENINNQAFSFKNLENEYPALGNEIKPRLEAKATFQQIADDNLWVDSFSNEDVQSLPIGIKKEISNIEYQVGFSKAYFLKNYTELTAFVRIILPQTNERGEPIELFFGANNIKISHGGGLVGDFNLVLLGDVFIPFNAGNWLLSLTGGFNMNTGVTENTTYVTIDCNGVKEFSLLGEVQFSRKLIVPIDPSGNLAPKERDYTRSDNSVVKIPNRVRGSFSMVASDWNDILVDISLSPFALAKHPDKFQFMVNQAILDFSDLRSPEAPFPPIYEEKNLFQPSFEAWRGIHINALQVALPKEFKTNKSISENKRITFSAYNMIIDDYGVSGIFEAENLFPINSGRTSKEKAWAYSLDRIGVEIQANTLTSANFEGQIILPLSKTKDLKNDKGEKIEELGLGYVGLISEDEYLLNVSTTNALNFDLWQAKARIAENSAIEMRVENGNFRPKAILHGTIDISAKNNPSEKTGKKTDDLANFKGIAFQNLQLQTVSPILQVDSFGYQGELKLANFPISVADIVLTTNDYEASLAFDINVNLMDKGFNGGTRLNIIGALENDNGRQRWDYKKLKLDVIRLEADIGKVTLKGELELMRDDLVYGNGFRAEVEGKFGDFGPIATKVIFGRNDFRYWYADASVSGLKIQAGIIQLSGFSGGASYRMTRAPGVSVSEFSPSGLSYVPDRNSGLGVKAMVIGGIPDEKTVSVGAGFEIEFNRNLGINRMGLFGEVQVMKALEFDNPAAAMQTQLNAMVSNEKLQKTSENSFFDKSKTEYPKSTSTTASIEGNIGINYDFRNDALHADMQLYVNTPGGFLQGYGPGGLAGWGVIHISKDDWYAYIGTPSKRIGLKLGVGPVTAETTGYFMTGTQLEGSPPPPQEVADILGVDIQELDYMRDENGLKSGRGFAFGTNFKVDTGDIRFLMFYASFMAGAGFDIMLRDYGEASCSNTGKQVGIDGWYANGQAYAYLQGELGIQVKLFFVKKKIPIIEAAAAVLLQAKAPNPIWMRGYLGGRYNLLGGLVKGKFRFKLVLGEECVLEDISPLGGIKMISDLSPKKNSNDVDVFAAPQASFSMKVNEPIVIPEDDGDKTYKVLLDKMEIRDEKGQLIEGNLEWGQGKDRVTFFSTDILPPETNLIVTCQLSFQEYVNGVFRTVSVDGVKATEIETRTFKTGSAPNHIPLHNIKYCYPTVDQKFVYKKEYLSGYIKLKRGQDYLFDDAQWKSSMALVDEVDEVNEFSMSYNQASNQVNYDFPNLKNTTKYTLSIVSNPKNSENRSTQNKTSKNNKQEKDEGDWDNSVTESSFEISKNGAENVSKEGSILRLEYDFGTSKHNTFSSKINALRIAQDLTGRVNSNTVYLQSLMQQYEGFDLVELEGNKYSDTKPLIVQEAVLDDAYYQQDIYPIVYQSYPLYGAYEFSRDTDVYGVIPKKALPIMGSYLENLRHDMNAFQRETFFPYLYNLPKTYEQDIYDIKVQINDRWASGNIQTSDAAFKFLDNYYEFMRYGEYNIFLKYTLPGNAKSVTKKYSFKNPLKIKI